jgi:flagellar biosynthetic protein FliR
MGAEPLIGYSTLFGFLYALARVSGVFAFLPLAAFRGTPETVRIVLSIAFTMLLRPEWKPPAGPEASIGRIGAGIAGEAALGLTIGLALAITLDVFAMAAQQISLLAGLGYASTIDPTSGADSVVLTTTAQLTAGLLFFATGADRLLVKALADSMRLVPPESFSLNKIWIPVVIQFASQIFSAGLRLAAPLLVLLLLADASLAILGRVQAQLQVISLTMPAKLAGTMLLLSATIVLQPKFFESLMTSWMATVEGLLRSVR